MGFAEPEICTRGSTPFALSLVEGDRVTARRHEHIRQFDNITQTVADDLKVQLGKVVKINVAAACFSIYAFEALKSELEGIDEYRFIFTSPAFAKELSAKQKMEFFIPKLQRERTLYGSDFELKTA